MGAKPRIAVVSPSLDKCHGTERCIVEQLQHLAEEYEFHVYSQRVADLDISNVHWHRIAEIPGPHLLKYLWWFIANHVVRWRDRRFRNQRCDSVYSPGINCLDADVISVHVVFVELVERLARSDVGQQSTVRRRLRRIHRRLYYSLIATLEGRIYRNPGRVLAAVSRRTAEQLERHFGKRGRLKVIYNGVDAAGFHPETREAHRSAARRKFGLEENDFVLLLIGNGWETKGLSCLLKALAPLSEIPWRLLVVGEDDRSLYEDFCRRLGVSAQVKFLSPSQDVIQFYAACDAYVGPSVEDSFALPPAEAMACAIPVIVSCRAGVSEIMTDGTDGLLLEDPSDSQKLSQLIRRLYDDPELRRKLGKKAVQTIRQYTWERNATELHALFEEALRLRDRAR